MIVDELLQELSRRGVKLADDGSQLKVQAPQGALTAELRAALTEHKDAMLALLREQGTIAESESPPLVPIARGGALRLSSIQERLWFLDQLVPDSAAYHLPGAARLRGPLDVDAFRRSLQRLIDRHEALRTRFENRDGEPTQVVQSHVDWELERHDVAGVERSRRDEAALEWAREFAERPFDLARAPLFRFALVRLDERNHFWVHCCHHIVSDGWSTRLMLEELHASYDEATGGAPAASAPLDVQYADYAAWERQRLESPALARQLQFWRERLCGKLPVIELPTDRPRPQGVSYRGDAQSIRFSRELGTRLKQLARSERATPFMALHAGFVALLHRYSGAEDVIVGTPIASRHQRALEGVIGCFLNTIALRVDLSGDPSYRELLQRVRACCLESFANQDLPFEKLVEDLKPARDLSHSPIFQLTLTLMTGGAGLPACRSGLSFEPCALRLRVSKFDLAVELLDSEAGIEGWIEYSSDLFDASTMRRMAEHWSVLMEAALADPDLPIGSLNWIGAAELDRLASWNRTEREKPSAGGTLVDLFESQVAATPLRTAVRCGATSWSYGELNARANRLAAYLAADGVSRGDLVALCLGRSPQLLVGLLAIAKAGAAYLPLDPAYPGERLAYMLEDSGAARVITDTPSQQNLPVAVRRVLIDGEAAAIERLPEHNPPRLGADSDLAYMIYTSGSTGRPKGVLIEQAALANFLRAMRREPGLGEADVLLAVTTVCFDIAALELYLPLISGAQVVLAGEEQVGDARALAEAIDSSGATVMQATPATWQMLLESGWGGKSDLKILCGGEALAPELANRLLDRAAELWNLYGPTEVTVWATVERLRPGATRVTVGGPIDNTGVHILDRRGRLLPIGVTGRLFLSGAQLARGYHARPELTAEKFVMLDPDGGGIRRLYETGDLARLLGDGRLELLGRTDHQIKIRGFRVELGEIESLLRSHPELQRAAVIVREPRAGDKRLYAYLVHRPGCAPNVSDLRRFCRKRLPEYMVPSKFVEVEQFPLTPNGKVDRLALARLEGAFEDRAAFTPPATEMEQRLAQIWCEVLEVERVGQQDNFFDLGGHSLLLMRVIAKLERQTGIRLSPREMFMQTLRQVAARCEGRASVAEAEATADSISRKLAGAVRKVLFRE